ncbi:heat shock 70 kDa protein 12B-like [Colossoma macropomum]|uniref:heat shock 70 kDa protein 12B-like n=1 Tax=Colossoma macropomum TaxID=42526 RepID=UPI001864797C|nr:heat shock 70 kDa protein 12B-like [Colossoma macropomum]
MESTESDLLDALKELQETDLKEFQWRLTNGVDGSKRIPRSQTENIDRPDTVDRMVQYYGPNGAVDITLKILEKLNLNQLAEKLRQKMNLRKRSKAFSNNNPQQSTTITGTAVRLKMEKHSQAIEDLRSEKVRLEQKVDDLSMNLEEEVKDLRLRVKDLEDIIKRTEEKADHKSDSTDPHVPQGFLVRSGASGSADQPDPQGSQGRRREPGFSYLTDQRSTEDRRGASMPCFTQDSCRAEKDFIVAPKSRDTALSIAIQIGASFSGYSFQFRARKQIRSPKWGLEYGYDTPQTPTCILFDEDGEFLKFGYDAVMTYTRQTSRNEAQRLYYFDNFKMELCGKELHRELKIRDRSGKEMRAMKVFSESLRFIKDHALETIGKHTAGRNFSASDATWILTVPVIWSSAVKPFMREAATEAGLVAESDAERLIVILESEAACVWCKKLPIEGFMEGDLEESKTIEDVPGTQYMVVDCGGLRSAEFPLLTTSRLHDETIDITVHEVMDGGRLKELYIVSANDMGGQTVDNNFRSFLREIFSDKVFDEFEENHPTDLQKLILSQDTQQ